MTARCVVLGGGFGGLAAAHRLRARLGEAAEITVVDSRGVFMMGLRILWTLVGQADRVTGTRGHENLAAAGMRFLKDEVREINPDRRTVTTGSGVLSFDALVVALGAELRPDLMPGYDPLASNLYDPDQVEAIAARVAAIEGGRIGIGILGIPYKCPPAPYEAAFLIDEFLRRHSRRDRVDLEIFTPTPSSLPIAGAAVCAQVEGRLAARGIRFLPGRKALGVEGREVVFERERRAYDLLIGIPPHRAPAVARASGLAADDWIRPDPSTCATAWPTIFAVGDVTEMPLANGMMLPKAGVFAEAQGLVAADRIADLLSGREASATFDGEGYCFIETGDGKATAVRGRFFASPEPVVEVEEPSTGTLDQKRKFEVERLARWFP